MCVCALCRASPLGRRNETTVQSTIELTSNKKGSSFNITGCSFQDLEDVVLGMGFVSVTLNDPSNKLFSKHMSFTDCANNLMKPTLSKSYPLIDLLMGEVSDVRKIFVTSWSPIVTGICEASKQCESVANSSEGSTDSPFMKRVLQSFVDGFPYVTYDEIRLEYATDKKVVGGALDTLIGCSANGNRPFMAIPTSSSATSSSVTYSVYFGSLCEDKDIKKVLMAKRNERIDFRCKDNKAVIQPSAEIMAIAQKCCFPKNNVPLLLIYGSRVHFRAFLYFKAHDVLLTTPTVIPFVDVNGKLFTFGLMALHLLFRIHRFPFKTEELEKMAKSGWADAMSKGSDNYSSSVISVVGRDEYIPHVDAVPIAHDMVR